LFPFVPKRESDPFLALYVCIVTGGQPAKIKEQKKQKTMQKKVNGKGSARERLEIRRQYDAKVQQLTDTAWNFAYSLQWNGEIFSPMEIQSAKDAIAAFLHLHKTPEAGFAVFCQRTVIAQNGISKILYLSGALPSQWFDWRNDGGFVSTKAEYDRIEKTRASLPLHKRELRQLADAVIGFAERPTKETYLHWKEYFANAKAQHLFGYFQAAAINQLYNS
jgi:hypothetical protein